LIVIVRLVVLAASVVALGASSASADPAPCVPNTLVLAGGSGQTAQLRKPFDTPLQVLLANTSGCQPTSDLAGHLVDFYAPGDGASGTFPSTGSREAVVGTNAQGVATAPSFAANSVAGSYGVTAHSDWGNVHFWLTNTAAGVPAQLLSLGQTSDELQARVLDANGNPVSGVTVAFAVAPGSTGAGATFLGGQGTAVTDADGVATSPTLVPNGIAGAYTATALVAGLSTVAVYPLANHAQALTLTGTRSGSRLAATLRDAQGQPVEGATVTFAISATQGGAGATFVGGAAQATAVTDATGLALSPRLVPNTVAGAYTAVATATGAARAVTYPLVNRAGAPSAIAAAAAAHQSTAAGTRFAARLAATVTDKNGNAVANAVVVFSAPRSAPSGHFAGHGRTVRVRTDSKGVAAAPPFVAGRAAGGYVVVARVNGHRTAFALVNT
jgi:Bacterial Ig-like domain (group 1)